VGASKLSPVASPHACADWDVAAQGSNESIGSIIEAAKQAQTQPPAEQDLAQHDMGPYGNAGLDSPYGSKSFGHYSESPFAGSFNSLPRLDAPQAGMYSPLVGREDVESVAGDPASRPISSVMEPTRSGGVLPPDDQIAADVHHSSSISTCRFESY
jgi:hypothetical protein